MFTDGSSFRDQGQRKAVYVVLTHQKTLEAEALPQAPLHKRWNLTALMRAFHLGKDERITIFTDSKYAFLVVHAHGGCLDKGLLTAEKKETKHAKKL